MMVSENWADDTDIQAAGTHIEIVEDFCYLGSYISNNSSCEKDMKVRIGKAAASFGRLSNMYGRVRLLAKLSKSSYTKRSYCPYYCIALNCGPSQ